MAKYLDQKDIDEMLESLDFNNDDEIIFNTYPKCIESKCSAYKNGRCSLNVLHYIHNTCKLEENILNAEKDLEHMRKVFNENNS